MEGISRVQEREQRKDVDMAYKPEHLLLYSEEGETECTNRPAAYRQGSVQ